MTDAPVLYFDKPFRFQGALVQATDWSVTHDWRGGTFALKGVLLYEEPSFIDAESTAAADRPALASPPLAVPALIEPEPPECVTADLVEFEVRSIRYGCPIVDDGHESIEDAVCAAMWQFDDGYSCEQEVWCGDQRVLDLDGILAFNREHRSEE